MGSSSLTRDRIWAPYIGSMESEPLGHQGSPWVLSRLAGTFPSKSCFLVTSSSQGGCCKPSLFSVFPSGRKKGETGRGHTYIQKVITFLEVSNELGLTYTSFTPCVVCSWCHTLFGFGQLYNDPYLLLQNPTG